MTTITAKIRFDKSGYYFFGLIVIILAGFWQSYFSRFFNGTNNYSFYFHFHAVMMSTWVALLITQPILIRKKKLAVHRLLGKLSYFIMPVLLISVLLVLNNGLKKTPPETLAFINIIFPFRDFFILIAAFAIGTRYRKNINIHARAMIATGIVFIEPALSRFLGGVVFRDNGLVAFIVTIAVVLGVLITLIIIERKQKSGRWIFPSLLAIFVTVYLLVILQVNLSAMDPLVIWFSKLPLT